MLAKRSGNAGHVGGACKSCEEHMLGDPPFYGVEPGHQTLPPSPLRYTLQWGPDVSEKLLRGSNRELCPIVRNISQT